MGPSPPCSTLAALNNSIALVILPVSNYLLKSGWYSARARWSYARLKAFSGIGEDNEMNQRDETRCAREAITREKRRIALSSLITKLHRGLSGTSGFMEINSSAKLIIREDRRRINPRPVSQSRVNALIWLASRRNLWRAAFFG